jgi:hypothetical protein
VILARWLVATGTGQIGAVGERGGSGVAVEARDLLVLAIERQGMVHGSYV